MSGNFSEYYDEQIVAAAVARGDHRGLIGGMWDEIGELQLAFLRGEGLTPADTLLDIGCGSLRLGVRAVAFLEAGHYWGTDLSAALMEAGYEREIVPCGLSHKLPRTNLIVDERFDFAGVPASANFIVAQSVFTHLPFNHLRVCLGNLGRHLIGPSTFFFTVFTPPEGMPVTQSHAQSKGGITTHPDRDPYHYTVEDIRYGSTGTPWSIEFIGEWGHPRNQMMIKATKE